MNARPARPLTPLRRITSQRAILLLCLWSAACGDADPARRARRGERDQLRREVAGYRGLESLAGTGLLTNDRQVLVSISDTLTRDLLDASFPIPVPLAAGITVTLTGATVTFRGNVARVDVVGQLRRTRFPSVAASVALRGAFDAFAVDSDRVLRARVTVDDAWVDTPTGVPGLLDPVAIAVLQRIVERGLPELAAMIPAVAIPVRLDREMTLPAFGESAALSVAAVRAPLSVTAQRVIAFQNRLWFILRVERGEFAAMPGAP
ncbi:MAG: hypothetical protein K8S21_02545 [Gemmatimonadetes bacterium]|nr:hypothetical protein [Gemmatimonadota bacterium]